jgi:hypothetical protein
MGCLLHLGAFDPMTIQEWCIIATLLCVVVCFLSSDMVWGTKKLPHLRTAIFHLASAGSGFFFIAGLVLLLKGYNAH